MICGVCIALPALLLVQLRDHASDHEHTHRKANRRQSKHIQEQKRVRLHADHGFSQSSIPNAVGILPPPSYLHCTAGICVCVCAFVFFLPFFKYRPCRKRQLKKMPNLLSCASKSLCWQTRITMKCWTTMSSGKRFHLRH